MDLIAPITISFGCSVATSVGRASESVVTSVQGSSHAMPLGIVAVQ